MSSFLPPGTRSWSPSGSGHRPKCLYPCKRGMFGLFLKVHSFTNIKVAPLLRACLKLSSKCMFVKCCDVFQCFSSSKPHSHGAVYNVDDHFVFYFLIYVYWYHIRDGVSQVDFTVAHNWSPCLNPKILLGLLQAGIVINSQIKCIHVHASCYSKYPSIEIK